jgi:hypothetical protein
LPPFADFTDVLEKHPKSPQLFAVELEQRIGADNEPDVVFTRSDYEAMRRETSVFTDACAIEGALTRIEGRLALSSLVTGNFFQVLGSRPRSGGRCCLETTSGLPAGR